MVEDGSTVSSDGLGPLESLLVGHREEHQDIADEDPAPQKSAREP